MNNYDVIVIGGGPAGYSAASLLAQEGKNVLLVEKSAVGGTCLNVGCMPTKTLLNIAKYYNKTKELQKMGLDGSWIYQHDVAMDWKKKALKTLRSGVENLLKSSKVTVKFGEAQIQHLTPNEKIVLVDSTPYSAEYVLIASGLESTIPSISGIEGANPLTSTEILSISKVPSKLAIIGGGFIGIEFACIFSQLGSKVTVFEALPEILPAADKDCSQLLREIFTTNYGVDFHLNARISEFKNNTVIFSSAENKQSSLEFDTLLVSTGRKTKLEIFKQLGLDTTAVGIVVDKGMQTNIPQVYAIGDVVGTSQLAHSATRMAEVAVENILGNTSYMRYNAIPSVVYTDPELAGCGLTEHHAKEKGIEIVSASLPIIMSGKVVIEHGTTAKGLCKIIAEKNTGKILGMYFVGPMASEIISTAVVILEAQLRIQELVEMIFPHPTVGEIIHSVSKILLKKIKQGKS